MNLPELENVRKQISETIEELSTFDGEGNYDEITKSIRRLTLARFSIDKEINKLKG
jgi:hypothetical protein